MDDGSPLRRAKRPRSILAGPYGHAFHAMIVPVPIGAWVASVVFDLVGLFGDNPRVFEQGAQWLVGIGLVGAIIAGIVGAMDLGTIAAQTPVRKIALSHMSLNLAAMLVFAISFGLRLGIEEQVSVLAFVLSVIGVVLIGASGFLGGEMTYRYGVRVADEETQQKGFEVRT